MDAVYSSWGTPRPDGFSDAHIATLERIAPYLALAIKSVSLARMTKTLMETYLKPIRLRLSATTASCGFGDVYFSEFASATKNIRSPVTFWGFGSVMR